MRYAIPLILLLSACAAPPPVAESRYLTLEEDQALRDKCEPYEAVGGCVAIPAPAWIQIMRRLKNPGRDT